MHTRLLHGRAFAARSMLSAHTALIQDGVPPDADADDIEAFLAQGYPKVRAACWWTGESAVLSPILARAPLLPPHSH